VPVARRLPTSAAADISRFASLIVALGILSACSGAAETAATTTRPTAPRTTVEVTTTRPATTTTTEPEPEPTTTRPAPTTTTAPTTTLAPETTTTTEPPSEEFVPPTWPPYTPLPGVPGVDALTNVFHPELENVPALAVKIDNHPQARPQWSLALADVIFEENVESLTRFIAIFHSRLPGVIGPIRSARTSDLNILAAFNRPVLAWSGGNKFVTATVRSAATSGILVNISAQSIGKCYRRESGRKAPHNLVVAPGCALGAAPSAGPARAPWTFDDTYVPAGTADGGFELRMDGVRVAWVWDPASGQYLRQQDGHAHVASDGTQIAASNVVVMSVVYVPSPADPRSPEAQTLGAGPVVVHRNGVAVAGTWSRATAIDPFTFTDAAGAPIPMASGTTFVELARA
jgi:Protein of unknown function (DUF3048) N-terminal domain/Protein of unknown function (DUF3048) C-terminal domain